MNSDKLLFFIILLVGCLSQFGSDIYTPALPAISIDLKTHINYVQTSMAIYMLGVAASLLIYGPISEGVGRKLPLCIGLVVTTVGSFICFFATSINVLILGRLIQGLGAGACAGLWRAIFRDTFTGDQLAKYGSYFAIIITFIVPAAPALGGYLLYFSGWRAIFAFMLIYSIATLVTVIIGFKETSLHHNRNKLKFTYCYEKFKTLLTSRVFVVITLCTFLSYGAFFAWFIVGPVLLIHVVGISAVTFGWLSFIGGGAVYALAGWLNGKFVSRFGITTMMRFGWGVMLLAGVLMLAGKFIFGTELWVIFIPALLFYFGSTFIWPNAFSMALTPFGDIAGYAGSLYSFMQLAGGAIIGGLVAHLPDTNQLPLAIVFMLVPMLAWLAYESLISRTLMHCFK